MYVKQAAEREERLAGLLAQVRDDDTTSYKGFSTPEELAELLEADLAILLAERFDASRDADRGEPAPLTSAMPRITSRCRPARCSAARPTWARCSSGWAATTLVDSSRSSAPAGSARPGSPSRPHASHATDSTR